MSTNGEVAAKNTAQNSDENQADKGPVVQKINTTTGNSVTNIFLRTRGAIQDILYIPESAAAIPIPLKSDGKKSADKHQNTIADAYERLKEESRFLSQRAEKLVQAKAQLTDSGGAESVIKAQNAVRVALAKVSSQSELSDDDTATEAVPPLDSKNPTLVEVYSLEKREMMLVARETLAKCETRNSDKDNVFYVYESKETEETPTKKTSRKDKVTTRPNLSVSDAFRFFRPSNSSAPKTGELDADKVKKAWEPVKKQIAAEWNLGAVKTEGQIPSRLAEYFINPLFAAFFDKEDYDAIDAFVAKVNESAQAKWNKHSEERDELIKELKKEGFSPDDWSKLLSKVKDIWWKGWRDQGHDAPPSNKFEEFADNFYRFSQFPKTKSDIERIATTLANEPLPPVQWDASAGAQLMRYSAGASGKAEFNVLETGRLAVSGKAEAKFNLAEGKADVGFFLPDSEGKDLVFKLPVRSTEAVWAPLKINGKPQHFFGNLSHFEFDKSIVSPKGIFELTNVFTGFKAASQSVQHLKFNPSDEPMVVQVIGHTDAVGKEAYNLKLSKRRARAACALLNNSPMEWVSFFKDKSWGEHELKLMLYYVLCEYVWNLGLDWSKIETHDEFKEQLTLPLRQRTLENQGQLLSFIHPNHDDAVRIVAKNDIRELVKIFQRHLAKNSYITNEMLILPSVDGNYDVNSANGLRTVTCLIHAYFYGVKNEIKSRLPKATFTEKLNFHTDQTIGLGETELLVKTQKRSRDNRRIELLAWAVTDEYRKDIVSDYNFGAVRLQFRGSISGEAGVNINLGANIAFDINKHALLAAGTIAAAIGEDVKVGRGAPDPIFQNEYEFESTTQSKKPNTETQASLEKFNAEAAAKGGAFAGAKAEANIKAAIDWRPPLDSHREKTKNLPPEKQTHNFLTLGDVGYMATAMAGAGLEGEFKVGFDAETRRFQIKVSAKASLGLGFGGGFSFSVAINHLFDFVKLVHKKLTDNDFHFIDVFENETQGARVDVYGLFCAVSFDLLKEGKPLQAGIVYSAGNALDVALTLLDEYRETIRLWKEAENISINIDKVIATIKDKPEQLQYLTPEIKGRLLFVLVEAKKQRLNQTFFQRLPTLIFDVFDGDLNDDLEEAALTLIEEGIHSSRDWQKTLQNMLSIDKQGNMCAPNGCDGNVMTKVTLATDNETYLRAYLLESEDDREALDKILTAKGILSGQQRGN